MNKTELLQTYTAEQLAEMVEKLKNENSDRTFKVSDTRNHQKLLDDFLKESPLRKTIDGIAKDIIEQKNNAMAMEFTRIICDLLKRYGVYVHCTETKFGEKITTNSIEEKYGIVFDSVDFSQHDKEFTDKIEELKNQLDRNQTTINQIDEILEDLFGVTHGVAKPDGFKEILREKVAEKIADFLPAEPIKVADMLISAAYKRQRDSIEKAFSKAFGSGSDMVTENVYSESELRQIAEHLLVCCNHNEGEEE